VFITGIYKPEQALALLPQARNSPVALRYLSYELLMLPHPASSADVKLFEQAMVYMRLSGGIYRTTYADRFADVDAAALKLLKRSRNARDPLCAEDWAASDCQTSCELAERLQTVFPGATLVASDLHFHLLRATRPGLGTYIFEESGNPLQFIRHPFVLPYLGTPSAFYFVNRALTKLSRLALARAWRAASAAQWKDILDDSGVKVGAWSIGRIPLIHPKALHLATHNPAFRIVRHSVLEPRPRASDFIRSMNILIRTYFGEDTLRQGIRAVFESLADGGLWVVGRTKEELAEPRNHASIWQRVSRGFELLERIGDGSEIDGLIGSYGR
jgi:hypothetical protein